MNQTPQELSLTLAKTIESLTEILSLHISCKLMNIVCITSWILRRWIVPAMMTFKLIDQDKKSLVDCVFGSNLLMSVGMLLHWFATIQSHNYVPYLSNSTATNSKTVKIIISYYIYLGSTQPNSNSIILYGMFNDHLQIRQSQSSRKSWT